MFNKKTWFETLYDNFGQYFSIDRVLYQEKTEYQELIIFENPNMGRIMALDGVIQTTERDEFIYHEMISHVPLIAHGQAKKVLIIGGGDGGVLREVSKHRNIDQITMVEIDEKVISISKEYLPNHSAGSFDDIRFTLKIDDGANFVKHCKDKFNIIISDCTDPIGPGERLFTTNFYQNCAQCLEEDGIFVAQNGVCFLQQEEAVNSYLKLGKYFNDISFYHAAVPTYYGGIMLFSWASQNKILRHIDNDIITARILEEELNCHYYNTAIHKSSFALPQYLLHTLDLM